MIFPTFGLVGYVGLVPLIGNCAIYFSAFVKSLMFGGALGFSRQPNPGAFFPSLGREGKGKFRFFFGWVLGNDFLAGLEIKNIRILSGSNRKLVCEHM